MGGRVEAPSARPLYFHVAPALALLMDVLVAAQKPTGKSGRLFTGGGGPPARVGSLPVRESKGVEGA